MKKTADIYATATNFAGYAQTDGWTGSQAAQLVALAGAAEAAMPHEAAGLVPRQERRNVAEHFTEMPGTCGDQLQRLLDAEHRDDADLLRDVVRALMLDTLVPATAHAQVRDGIVTLTGTVSGNSDREEAKLAVACVPGVLGITDHMTLIPAPDGDGDDAGAEIIAALGRTEIDAGELSVEIPHDGTVVLCGAVSSWADHDRAVAAALSVPGVTAVDDSMVVDR